MHVSQALNVYYNKKQGVVNIFTLFRGAIFFAIFFAVFPAIFAKSPVCFFLIFLVKYTAKILPRYHL